MEQAPSIPPYSRLLWPTLQAVRAIGGSGSVRKIVQKVVELEGFTEEQRSVPHGDGPRTEVEYRLAWSRTTLKSLGLLHSPLLGTWEVTEVGRRVNQAGLQRLYRDYNTRLREKRRHARDKQSPKSRSE
jgi:restriction system protein